MITFLIKSTICLALLFGFYNFFLEQHKIHRFNRFYLIGILLFSIGIPNIFLYIEAPILSQVNAISNSTIDFYQISVYVPYIFGVYLSVATIFLFRLARNLVSITQVIRKNPKIRYHNARIVLLKDKVLPHTFLKYVFVNREDYYSQNIGKELFTHELTHVNEQHTIDIIIAELFQVIFWFNPILFFLKKSIRLNHEFIADESVIVSHDNILEYQSLLLEIASPSESDSLSSSINYSVTKKRFRMMVKNSSHLTKSFAKISIVPLLITSVFLFANIVTKRENNLEEHSNNKTEVSSQERGTGYEHLDKEEHKKKESELSHGNSDNHQ